jgi:hypothetical protein
MVRVHGRVLAADGAVFRTDGAIPDLFFAQLDPNQWQYDLVTVPDGPDSL